VYCVRLLQRLFIKLSLTQVCHALSRDHTVLPDRERASYGAGIFSPTPGLLAILAKSIAIAIAILGGNSIAILSAILYFKSVLRYSSVVVNRQAIVGG